MEMMRVEEFGESKYKDCGCFTRVPFQLSYMLRMCASFVDLPAASQSQGLAECTLLSFSSHSLTHLHDCHLNTGFLNAELQANWHGIKPTKWLIKFNLTITSNLNLVNKN